MRNTTQCKRSNNLEDTTFIIVSSHIPYRSKSLGNKSFYLINNIPFIKYQINIIKETCPNSEIIVCTGFETEKFYNIENIRIVENQLYDIYGECESIKLSLNNLTTENAIILQNDCQISKKMISKIDEFGSSMILSDDSKKDNISCIVTEDYITHIGYGLEKYKWEGIVYLQKKEIDRIKKLSIIKNKKNLFVFELLNEIIDKGSKIRGIVR